VKADLNRIQVGCAPEFDAHRATLAVEQHRGEMPPTHPRTIKTKLLLEQRFGNMKVDHVQYSAPIPCHGSDISTLSSKRYLGQA
jgi:hypothetical protein